MLSHVYISAATVCKFQHQSDADQQVQPAQVENIDNNINRNNDYQQTLTKVENPPGRSSGLNNQECGEDFSPSWNNMNHEQRKSNKDFANGHDSRPVQDPKPVQRNSHQLIHQSSDGDLSQRAHRRNESDSRLGLLRRQHTDVALARRSDVYRNSKVEISFPIARSEVTTSVAGEPVLTDFMAKIGDEHQRSFGESGRSELRRQVSLDGDLHAVSSSGSAGREHARHEWNQRREKTDVDLRRAELRNELEQWRVTPQVGYGRDNATNHQEGPAHQVSWCGYISPHKSCMTYCCLLARSQAWAFLRQ